MTRLAVLLPLAAVIWVAFPLAIARFLRGPKTEEREAIGSDICKDGVHPDECPSCRPMPSASCCLNATKGWEHDPWCPTLDLDLPAVGRARVVASDDLTWQVDLAKFYRDYDTYRTELRLPGERAS